MTAEKTITALRAEVIAMLEQSIAADEAIIQAAIRCTIEFVCFSERTQMFLIVDDAGNFRFGFPGQARRFSQVNAERAAAHWNAGLAKMTAEHQHMTVEAMTVERGVMAHQERTKAALAELREATA